MEIRESWRLLSPWRARAVLAALLVLMAGAAYVGRAPIITGVAKAGEFCDNDMHSLVAMRVHMGVSYYDALGAELRRWGYATKPFFHWRLPTLLWSIGKLPVAAMARGALITLIAGLIVVWANRMRPYLGFPLTCVAGLLLASSLVLASIQKWYFQHELWAGVLIGLSLGLYPRHRFLALVCGVSALMVRELALPYVLVMCVMAARDRQVRETAGWLLGMAAFVVFLGIHARMVASHQMAGDAADPSWFRFAGWPFVVACSGWLFWALIPYWLSAVLLVFAVFGLLALREVRLVATVGIYMAAFSIVGKPFDDYWGLMYVPLLAIGLVHGIPVTAGLVRRALTTTSSSLSTVPLE